MKPSYFILLAIVGILPAYRAKRDCSHCFRILQVKVEDVTGKKKKLYLDIRPDEEDSTTLQAKWIDNKLSVEIPSGSPGKIIAFYKKIRLTKDSNGDRSYCSPEKGITIPVKDIRQIIVLNSIGETYGGIFTCP